MFVDLFRSSPGSSRKGKCKILRRGEGVMILKIFLSWPCDVFQTRTLRVCSCFIIVGDFLLCKNVKEMNIY